MVFINSIHITPDAGCELGELRQEMSRLSNKYKCVVTSKFNGVEYSVKPGSLASIF